MGDVDSVFARGATALVDIEAEDTAVVLLQVPQRRARRDRGDDGDAPKDLEGSISVLGEQGTVEIGGFAVNEMRTWHFARAAAGGRGRAGEVLGESAERLRLRPPGLLRARRRLHRQRRAQPGRRPRGPARASSSSRRSTSPSRPGARCRCASAPKRCRLGRAPGELSPRLRAGTGSSTSSSATASRSSSRSTSTAAGSATTLRRPVRRDPEGRRHRRAHAASSRTRSSASW